MSFRNNNKGSTWKLSEMYQNEGEGGRIIDSKKFIQNLYLNLVEN